MLAFERVDPRSAFTDGVWTGPWWRAGFDFERVVASWNAATPVGSSLKIELQAGGPAGESGWYALGLWSFDDATTRRTSVAGQRDRHGAVEVDTFIAAEPLERYRLRVTRTGSDAGVPEVRLFGAIASAGTGAIRNEIPSEPGVRGVELAVPSYSQRIHAGEYPEFGGGGEAWCSPASTAMVVAFWAAGPSADELAWVDPAYSDPCVDHAARFTFDHAYGGTGNWPFNTAYAAHYGLDAFVTRLRSLREAELFVAAGIPLVASITAGPGDLDGFPIADGTAGHLVVIAGFTPAGDPVVNDPAGESNATVRRVYDRAQFEQAWLRGSGGVVYVISQPGVELPPSLGNW